jgi:gamma-glutamyltranspeptidase/glutathione hydrolase
MFEETPPQVGADAVPDSVSRRGIGAPSRGPVFGSKYAVSQAAMQMMTQRGGNAADAAVAAAMVNVVVKPHYTHLGGDAFALIWRKRAGEVDCLNAGGRAPLAATAEMFAAGLPQTGPRSCTVPGFVDAVLEVYKGYATLPLATLFEPALRLCEEGFPVSLRLAGAMKMLAGNMSADTAALREVYLRNGAPYAPGETLRLPDLASTLREIVDLEREAFYDGDLTEKIAKAVTDAGGMLTVEDFKAPTAIWSEPLVTTYRGCDVYEQALPSQGLILLMALNIVENFPLAEWGASADALHVMIEATKLAFADSRRYSADPDFETVPAEKLLSKEHAKARAAEIDLERAKAHAPAMFDGDTTEFVVADGDIAIAFIQTIFSAWGSGFMVPGTGIVMTNRLGGFNPDPAHPNHVAPGKRTVHTLNTFMALRDGEMVVGGGTPGRDFQVQNNLQTLVGVIDWGLDLQAAVDMPRWVLTGGDDVAVEGRFTAGVLEDLEARGHKLKRLADWDGNVARSQVMATTPGGGWAVASDLRGEGIALAQ